MRQELVLSWQSGHRIICQDYLFWSKYFCTVSPFLISLLPKSLRSQLWQLSCLQIWLVQISQGKFCSLIDCLINKTNCFMWSLHDSPWSNVIFLSLSIKVYWYLPPSLGFHACGGQWIPVQSPYQWTIVAARVGQTFPKHTAFMDSVLFRLFVWVHVRAF